MANHPSTNGVNSNYQQGSYVNNTPSGLCTEKPHKVQTNNPPTPTPSPRGHA